MKGEAPESRGLWIAIAVVITVIVVVAAAIFVAPILFPEEEPSFSSVQGIIAGVEIDLGHVGTTITFADGRVYIFDAVIQGLVIGGEYLFTYNGADYYGAFRLVEVEEI